MRRVAVVLTLLLLGGCSAAQMPKAEDVQAYYAQPFSAEIELVYGENTAGGAFSKDGETYLLAAASPDSLAGLETELCGETAALRYAGMEKSFSASALPEGNPAALLRAMILALSAGEFTLAGTEGGATAAGDGFTLLFDAETLAPERAQFAEAGLSAAFRSFSPG